MAHEGPTLGLGLHRFGGSFVAFFEVEVFFAGVALFAGFGLFMGGNAAFVAAFLAFFGSFLAAGLFSSSLIDC